MLPVWVDETQFNRVKKGQQAVGYLNESTECYIQLILPLGSVHVEFDEEELNGRVTVYAKNTQY